MAFMLEVGISGDCIGERGTDSSLSFEAFIWVMPFFMLGWYESTESGPLAAVEGVGVHASVKEGSCGDTSTLIDVEPRVVDTFGDLDVIMRLDGSEIAELCAELSPEEVARCLLTPSRASSDLGPSILRMSVDCGPRCTNESN